MTAPKSSAAPMWITLGFGLGLAFAAYFLRERPARPPARTELAPTDPVELPRDAGTLAGLEQVFERWGGYAVWEDNVTEIAVWNPRRRRHSDFYEVRRTDGQFYFRSLAQLSRPLLDHGLSTRLPVQFTEPQWMREEFYRQNPNYDPASAPSVDLPPRPPERYERELRIQPPPRGLTPDRGE